MKTLILSTSLILFAINPAVHAANATWDLDPVNSVWVNASNWAPQTVPDISASPISGSFTNLPDGGIVTVNGNNFQASYEGGDGNDLTLTVVQ